LATNPLGAISCYRRRCFENRSAATSLRWGINQLYFVIVAVLRCHPCHRLCITSAADILFRPTSSSSNLIDAAIASYLGSLIFIVAANWAYRDFVSVTSALPRGTEEYPNIIILQQ
jgi:hypothetical protein